MPYDSKQKLRIATIVYWVLLIYIIAAFAWWAFSLIQHNNAIHELKKQQLSHLSPFYKEDLARIEKDQRRGVYKYIGEGSAFLLLIMIGALYIYRSVRRQFWLQQQQQNFVMAITHELKTPIAVSRLNLETLQKYQLEEEKRKKLLQTTLQETMRLDTLINNILISSQLEGNAYMVAKEELDFSHLVKDVIKNFQSRYPERNLIISIQEEVELVGDATLLKLLISNLLENANKYSPKEKPITLQLSQANSVALLEVVDEGDGIPDDEKKSVFQKFYRIGSEQTRKTQGTGLGLYISKKIAKDHKGDVYVKDNRPSGAKFIVQFHTST